MKKNEALMEAPSPWAAACEVQERFMRHLGGTVETLDYSARCRPVEELGGDCYNFAPLPNKGFTLAVGDASGKGVAAALMISNVQSSLRTALLFTGNDGAAALRAVNRQVHASSLADRYATLFYGVFDAATRTLRYVNAGHNPPLVIRRDRSIVQLEAGGAPVGMFPDWIYEESTIQLDPGDLVLGYTDGVIEALNSDGEEWRVEGLLRAASESDAQCAEEMVEAIFKSLDQFSRGFQTDDATVVAVQVH